MSEEQLSQEMTDDEALQRIALAMKDNAPTPDEKHNVHTFLHSVVTANDVTRIGNLKRDKDMDELGTPEHTVRGCKEMAQISRDIIENTELADFFEEQSQITLATSLSDSGFLVRQATVQTKAVADVTKRRKINKGWFGKQNVEEQGGDPYSKNDS